MYGMCRDYESAVKNVKEYEETSAKELQEESLSWTMICWFSIIVGVLLFCLQFFLPI